VDGSQGFAPGGVEDILAWISFNAYNNLDSIFQRGINRYIEKKMNEGHAGDWLNKIFDTDEFTENGSNETIQDILKDDQVYSNTIIGIEPMELVVFYSATSIAFLANQTDRWLYYDFIKTVSTSTKAMIDLFEAVNGADGLSEFFNDETIVNTIANSKESMTAIMYNTVGFAAMIASETAMGIVSENETAVNVLVEAIENAVKSENVLNDIKTDLTDIATNMEQIANTDIVIEEVGNVKKEIDVVVGKLQTVTSQTDILISNIDAILSSETATTAILNSETATTSILNSETASGAVGSNEIVMEKVVKNEDLIIKILNSETGSIHMIPPLLFDNPVTSLRTYLKNTLDKSSKFTSRSVSQQAVNYDSTFYDTNVNTIYFPTLIENGMNGTYTFTINFDSSSKSRSVTLSRSAALNMVSFRGMKCTFYVGYLTYTVYTLNSTK
jgi:hypothetical protein